MHLKDSNVDIRMTDMGLMLLEKDHGNIVTVKTDDIEKLKKYLNESVLFPTDDSVFAQRRKRDLDNYLS